MTKPPTPFEPDPYDYMIAATLDMIEEGIPLGAVSDLCVIAQDAQQFFVGMQAMVHLGDIIKDHYHKGEPDDGPYDEEEDRWGTEGDDFDPPDEWFGEGGPFDPNL